MSDWLKGWNKGFLTNQWANWREPELKHFRFIFYESFKVCSTSHVWHCSSVGSRAHLVFQVESLDVFCFICNFVIGNLIVRIILSLVYVFCFRPSSMNVGCTTSLIMLISRSNTMMGQGKTGKELVWCLQRSHQEGMNCTNNTVREGHSGLMVRVLSWTLELRGLGLGSALFLVYCCWQWNPNVRETCQNAGQE